MNARHSERLPPLEEALRRCAVAADDAADVAKACFESIRKKTTALRNEVGQVAQKLHGDGPAWEQARAQVEKLQNDLGTNLGQDLADAARRVKAKLANKHHFTVALFGRTMAGKSTIREALTHGDGSTIGKGAQNTTREIREYYWNDLRVLDAPGIASSDTSVREELNALARKAFEQADLVLFLLSSDGIQESVFEGLGEIRDQAKPVLFILNYKIDLTKRVLRSRFLANGGLEAQTIRDELRGHENRLRSYATERLGLRDAQIEVIPVHAQAAFLGRAAASDEERALLKASRMETLASALANEVRRSGAVRRIQTIVDGSALDVSRVRDNAHASARSVETQADYVEKKFAELDAWFDRFIGSVNERTDKDAKAIVAALRQSVGAFVEENLESSDVAKAWKRHVKHYDIDGQAKRWQRNVLEEVQAHVNEFARQVNVEGEFRDLGAIGDVHQADPFDFKRMWNRTSAVAAGATTVLATGAALNWWNPAGWVMGALAGVGLLAGIFGWFSDSREEKLAKERAKAAKRLRESVDEMGERLAGSLRKWFFDAVTSTTVRDLRHSSKAMVRSLRDLTVALRRLVRELDEEIDGLHRHLLRGASAAVGTNLGEVLRIARVPANKTKLLVAAPPSPDFGRRVGVVLGEWIEIVENGSLDKVVAGALQPARVQPGDVRLKTDGAHVRLAPQEIGKAIGKGGINVRLASRLVGQRIRVEPHGGG